MPTPGPAYSSAPMAVPLKGHRNVRRAQKSKLKGQKVKALRADASVTLRWSEARYRSQMCTDRLEASGAAHDCPLCTEALTQRRRQQGKQQEVT